MELGAAIQVPQANPIAHRHCQQLRLLWAHRRRKKMHVLWQAGANQSTNFAAGADIPESQLVSRNGAGQPLIVLAETVEGRRYDGAGKREQQLSRDDVPKLNGAPPPNRNQTIA